MNIAISNPEFLKNLWLKFSPFRLLAMPILVGAVLTIFITQDENWAQNILGPSINLYMLIVFIWGNYEAAAAITMENKGNTWDFQRMSSIGPWTLSLGKLFGSTSYVWYFGLPILILIGISYENLPDEIAQKYPLPVSVYITYLIMAGVMGHATALMTSLDGMKYKKTNLIGPFLAGIIVSNGVSSFTGGFSHFGLSRHTRKAADVDLTVSWHGISIDPQIFVIASLVFFFFWIILGLQRKMREELQFKNAPIAWTSFAVTLAIYASGFAGMLNHSGKFYFEGSILIAYITISVLLYLCVYKEAPNLSKYIRFLNYVRARDIKRMWESTPMWLPLLVVILPLFVLINILSVTGMYSSRESIAPFSTALLLFLFRDAFVLHFILLGERIKHSRFVLTFYYLMMYGILPFLCSSLSKGAGHQGYKNWGGIITFFYPVPNDNFLEVTIPALMQAVIAGLLLETSLRRWEKKKSAA